MMRAIHSPSKFSLVITTMPRRWKYKVPDRIRPCQNAMIGWRPDAHTAS
jgi:hypothetical protein